MSLENGAQPSAEVRSLQAESNTFQQRLGNLLARIHRDGGHYISEHGWDKACADADEKLVSGIVTISQENDSLKAENAKLLEIAKGMKSAIGRARDVFDEISVPSERRSDDPSA